MFVALLAAVHAPALDWVDRDVLLPHLDVYRDAVAAFARASVCRPPTERYAAQHRQADRTAGQPLVLPLQDRSVPVAASYEQHFLLASRLPWGGSDARSPRLPPDLECAVQHTHAGASLGSLESMRVEAARAWRATCESLRPLSRAIVARHALPYARMIMGDSNVACLAASVDALNYRDRDLPRQTVMGFELVGCHLPDPGVYRPVSTDPARRQECEAQLAKMRDPASAAAWAASLSRRTLAAAARDPAAAKAVADTTRKELSRGLIKGPYPSFAALRAAISQRAGGRNLAPWLLPRFARWQGEEKGFRAIDDGKSSGTNNATVLAATIVCPGFDFPLVVARALAGCARRASRALGRMTVALHDLTAAYRFVLNGQPHLSAWPVATPAGAVQYYFMPGHPFGCVSSVLNFNRLAEAAAVVARSLGLPAEHYYDDFILPDAAEGGASAELTLEEIIAGLGDGRPLGTPLPRRAPSLDAKKKLPAAALNVVLGVEVDLSEAASGEVVRFRPTARRCRAILGMWREARAADRMTAADASTLLGKTGFAIGATYGKVGRAATLPLVDRIHRDDSTGFTPAMAAAHDFFEALLGPGADGSPRLPDLVAPLHGADAPPVLIYTDASYRRKRLRPDECDSRSPHVARLGFVVHDPAAPGPGGTRGLTLYATAVPSAAVMATFTEGKATYITQLEALAALTAYAAASAWQDHGIDLRGRDVNHFIDNTGALSAFVNGYARVTDLAKVSNAFWLLAAGMRVRPWLEYVPSAANIADLPSRDDHELLGRLGARRVTALPVVSPSDWQAPLADWLERGAGRV